MGSAKKPNESPDTAPTGELHPVNENDTAELKNPGSVPVFIQSPVRHEPDRLSTGIQPRPVDEAKRPEPTSDLGLPLADLSRPPRSRLATRVSLGLLVFGLGFYAGFAWPKLSAFIKSRTQTQISAQGANARKPASETPPRLWRPPKLKKQK